MNNVSYAMAILFATCAPIYAQTGAAAGTWRVDGVGPSLPTLVLRVDGPRLTGTVRVGPTLEISEGSIADGTLTFKVRVPGVMGMDLTIAFTGEINGNEMSFTREVQVPDGGSPRAAVNGMFAPRFIVKRVSETQLSIEDAEQIARTDQVRGLEFAAGVSLPQKNVKVEGKLFLPERVSRLRAVVVVMRWGNGSSVYDDPEWRRLSEALGAGLLRTDFSTVATPIDYGPRSAGLGGAEALLLLLRLFAQESGHQELADAPLLFWGHSAYGGWGPTFAAVHPQRTIAFVVYQSAGGGADTKGLVQIPALIVKDGGPNEVGPLGVGGDPETLWRSGRSAGAPWTFVVQPGAPHGSQEYLKKANGLVVPWIAGVLRRRLSPDAAALRVVTDGSAWLGNNRTGEVASYDTFPGSKAEASWLPDEPTARGWRVVLGASK